MIAVEPSLSLFYVSFKTHLDAPVAGPKVSVFRIVEKGLEGLLVEDMASRCANPPPCQFQHDGQRNGGHDAPVAPALVVLVIVAFLVALDDRLDVLRRLDPEAVG